MTNIKGNEERARIRAARYAPGRGFYEVTEMTLNNLPKRKRIPLRNRVLAVSSAAAALTLLLVVTAPTLVRAATQLYQRLFGQVVSQIEAEQALPEDEKRQAMVDVYEGAERAHDVEGASAELGGVTVSVTSLRTMSADKYGGSDKGELDLWISYSEIPSFDPNYVDFSLVVDGKEIPLKVDENLSEYRASKQQTQTSEEWADEWSISNSYMEDGKPTTWLTFDVDSWKWDEPKNLELKATVDGETLSIPFRYDPVKAHERAVQSAEISMKLAEENYEREKDSLNSMGKNAVPVGLYGTTNGHDWMISEMSFADGTLYFSASFGGVTEKNPKIAGMNFWLEGICVDGLRMGDGGSSDGELKDDSYASIYHYKLMQKPENLPKESIICLGLELGDSETEKEIAFRYNWLEKKVTLPENDAEMQAWMNQSDEMAEALKAQNTQSFAYDLRPLNIQQTADGVTMKIVAVGYSAKLECLEVWAEYDGDTEASRYDWRSEPYVGIGSVSSGVTSSHKAKGNIRTYDIELPYHISQFGDLEDITLDLPLYEKDAPDEAEAAETLRFAFTLDKSTLNPLELDENGEVILP